MSIPASRSNVTPLFFKESQKKPSIHDRTFPLRLLQDQDYTLILGSSCVSFQVPQLPENWQQAQSIIQVLGQTCADLDRNGIKLYIASEQGEEQGQEPPAKNSTSLAVYTYEQVSSQALGRLLQSHYPPANLDVVSVLEAALEDYFQRKAKGQAQPNGELFLVMLDGEPRDRQRLANLIVQTTQRMDNPQELAIGLVQIGEDSLAQGFFQALDDNLHWAGAVYDIVHTQNVATIDCEYPHDFLWDVLTD